MLSETGELLEDMGSGGLYYISEGVCGGLVKVDREVPDLTVFNQLLSMLSSTVLLLALLPLIKVHCR